MSELTPEQIAAGVSPETGIIDVPQRPSSTAEARDFDPPAVQRERAHVENLKGDIRLKRHYFRLTHKITGRWACFIMAAVVAQMGLNAFGVGLSEASFIALITTTTATLLGFWYLIGRYLFPGAGKTDQ
ncbi:MULTISPECIES: hypothetical protein [unclassified Sphingomonas]|uniref:hypothetical protein n=1 Tax=unclassified Sphingomonas TaxID=196159 RepID=UPI0012E2BB62|nr:MULTISPECIES: hypothetical protein [unclassified Sphingomonas]